MYALGGGRLLYTFPTICTEKPLRRCSVQILLTLRDQPFQLTVEGRTGYYYAAVIKPRVARTCRAQEGIVLQVDPGHPQFRRFRAIDAMGVRAIDRATLHKCE